LKAIEFRRTQVVTVERVAAAGVTDVALR
jgi:hypothetical protein